MDLKSLNERLFNLINEDQYEGADEDYRKTCKQNKMNDYR